uniref:BPTI/Kunitz inhibitor domain-containing protein n=1 Tax=Coturnix japonica TaxID=93934 RepID=A0A8C2Y7V0_COTJA
MHATGASLGHSGALMLRAVMLTALQKPGLCPRDFTRCLQQEPPLCTNDSTCPGWLKCCSHKSTAPRGAQGCAADICHLPAVPGPCGGHELSFFYNVTSGQCETFPYSGCGGNANRFGTWAACRRVCLGHGEGTELWVVGQAWEHSRSVSKLFLFPPQPP